MFKQKTIINQLNPTIVCENLIVLGNAKRHKTTIPIAKIKIKITDF